MEPSVISIKIRGPNAIQALHDNLQIFSGAKAQGAAVLGKNATVAKAAVANKATVAGKGAFIPVGNLAGTPPCLFAQTAEIEAGRAAAGTKTVIEIEGGRLAATKGVAMRATEVEAKQVCPLLAKSKLAASATKNATIAGAAAPASAAAKSAATSGTIWSGTGLSLGLGLGLGALGPFLLLTSLGLVATGIYMYRRNRALAPEFLPEEEVM